MAARKIRCLVSGIRNYGEGVYGVMLQPQERPPRFAAGQFLHLAMDPYDPAGFWPDSRAFSIASPPSDGRQLEILYSVKGRFTARMENELRVGAVVWVKLPYGDFRFDDVLRPRWLIAGGTGISAFAGLLRGVVSQGRRAPVALTYGIRNEHLFFFRDIIEALADNGLVSETTIFVENGPIPSNSRGIRYLAGRIRLSDVPDNLDEAWLAGPPGMIEYAERRLSALGLSRERIHIDHWE